jgi:hypothetical protein
MRCLSYLLVGVILLPFFAGGGSVLPTAQAASGCEGNIVNPVWNETVQRHALVPFSSWEEPFYGDEVWVEDTEGRPSGESNTKTNGALHPEASWMYNPTWPLPALDPFEDGHYITMEIGNDSVGALRFNLSSAHRTTFCVTLSVMEGNESQPVSADVYLMTASQYNRYEEVYRMVHGGWWMWDAAFSDQGDMDLSNIPPEWRSFDPTGWQTYRDVHQYEGTSSTTFSVTLDGPEVYSSLFGSDDWQDFYLVVDTWDNTHDSDALAPDAVVVADVTVIANARSVLFPPWTVPLVLLAAFSAVILVPVVLNKRYMDAGLGDAGPTSPDSTVPHLERSAVENKSP